MIVRTSRRVSAALAAACVSGLLIAGPATLATATAAQADSSAGSSSGSTLRVAMDSSGVDTLNPFLAYFDGALGIFGDVYLYVFRWTCALMAGLVFSLGWGVVALLRRPPQPGAGRAPTMPRWVAGGGAPNWAIRRRMLSRAGSLYARVALALPFSDIHHPVL